MPKAKDNFEKYRAHLKERGYDKLTPMAVEPPDLNMLMKKLAMEGNLLLEQDDLAKIKKPTSNTDSPKVLENALGDISKNPYVRARIQVLKDLSTERRERIEKMEKTGNIDNSIYAEFIKMCRILGDRFSDKENNS